MIPPRPLLAALVCALASSAHADFSREFRAGGLVARVSEDRHEGRRVAVFEVRTRDGRSDRSRQRAEDSLRDAFLADLDRDGLVELGAICDGSLLLARWDGRELDDLSVPKLDDPWRKRHRGGDRYWITPGGVMRQFRAERGDDTVRVTARLDLRRQRWEVEDDTGWGGGWDAPGRPGTPQALLDIYADALRRDDRDAARRCFADADRAVRFKGVVRITVTRLLPVGLMPAPRGSRDRVEPGDVFADAVHWMRDGDRERAQYHLRNTGDRRDPRWRIVRAEAG